MILVTAFMTSTDRDFAAAVHVSAYLVPSDQYLFALKAFSLCKTLFQFHACLLMLLYHVTILST